MPKKPRTQARYQLTDETRKMVNVIAAVDDLQASDVVEKAIREFNDKRKATIIDDVSKAIGGAA